MGYDVETFPGSSHDTVNSNSLHNGKEYVIGNDLDPNNPKTLPTDSCAASLSGDGNDDHVSGGEIDVSSTNVIYAGESLFTNTTLQMEIDHFLQKTFAAPTSPVNQLQ
jgi:hypothetical protein